MLNRKRTLIIILAILIASALVWTISPADSRSPHQRWLDADVQRYHLRGTAGWWFGGAFEFDLVVDNGHVVDSSCFEFSVGMVTDEPCGVDLTAYTIPPTWGRASTPRAVLRRSA